MICTNCLEMAASDNKDFPPTLNDFRTPKLIERIESLYNSSQWHDCEFKLSKTDDGREETIYAHSLILASCSPVFEALCFGPMAEKSPIYVPDIDPSAFRIMIKFMYTDKVEFSSVEMACNVLYASKKYLIYSLSSLAISYISYHINESNCLQVHEFATYIHEERLIKESWSFLCSHLEDVLKHFTYDTLSKELINSVLDEEALNGGEIIVFKICLLWAEAECYRRNIENTGDNMRKLLIEIAALSKIRLLTLTLNEFEDGPKKSGILNDDEINFVTKTIIFLQKLAQDTMGDRCLLYHKERNIPSDTKIPKSIESPGSSKVLLQKKIIDDNSCPVISSIIVARKKIPLKKIYCYRYIERDTRHSGSHNGLKILTVVSSNKSVRLTGIFVNAKILPIPQLNTIYTHTCVIERDYKEKMHVKIINDLSEVLFNTFFTETVKYGTIFKIPIPTPIVLERIKEYEIKIDFVNSVENYQFGVRNSVSKFPSGLSVHFKEWASIGPEERFVESDDLSVISGLELSV